MTHSPSHAVIRKMAQEIRWHRAVKINTDGIQHVIYESIGDGWVSRFIQRHPQLITIKSEIIEHSRVKKVTWEAVNDWFTLLKEVVKNHKIKPQNIYNMDETGNSIGSIQGGHVVVNKTAQMKYQLEPGRQE